MTLANLTAILPPNLTPPDWWATTLHTAQRIARYRRYARGQFDDYMTPAMRRIANIPTGATFGANHCDAILSAMLDRLHLIHLDSLPEPADWLDHLLKLNRFDALQLTIHRAALIDGHTYLLIDWDNHAQRPRFTHQPAFDGISGIIPLIDPLDPHRLTAAIKIWPEASGATRINLYHPDRLEKYSLQPNGDLTPLTDPIPWLDLDNQPLGIPLIRFINRPPDARSELESIIPIQDMLTRAHYSMTVAAELTAFRIYVAKGFAAPPALSVGMILNIAPDGLPDDQQADFYALPGADITPYLQTAQHLIEQLYDVSQTPYHRASSTSSGEALKQREAGLLGKVRHAQINFGNAWEDAAAYALRLQATYGLDAPAAPPTWEARWQHPQLRYDRDMVSAILQARPVLGDQTALQLLQTVFDFA